MKFMTFRADGLALRPLAAALVALTIGGNAVAQDLVLEEVTVTAKKTEVKLQDAAIAVSVTSGSDLTRQISRGLIILMVTSQGL